MKGPSRGTLPYDQPLVVSPDDPRLSGMGQDEVSGADQMGAMLAATPDERLDGLVAILEFLDEARAALRHAMR